MKQAVRKLVFKLYKFINLLPFNNKHHGKTIIENDGAILLRCHINSTGKGNHLVLRGGGYTITANLFSSAATTQ